MPRESWGREILVELPAVVADNLYRTYSTYITFIRTKLLSKVTLMPTNVKTTTSRNRLRAAKERVKANRERIKAARAQKMTKASTISVNATKVRQEFASWVGTVRYGTTRILVKTHGRPAVAIVSMHDLALLRSLEDKIDIEDARKAMEEEGEISLEEVKARLGF